MNNGGNYKKYPMFTAFSSFATVMNGAFSCWLMCRDQNGEIYYVTFTRKNVRISSYQDDAIRNKVETWADGIVALE